MKNLFTLLFVAYSIFLNAQDSFIIKDVRVFDGEKTIEKTSVLVEDGLIAEINSEIKGNHTTIDGSGKTLIPAMTNAHVHAWASASLQEAAKAGVLNLFDMHGVEPYQKTMVALKDSTNYANYYIAGYAATAPDGHGTQYGFPVPTLSSPKEAERFVSDRINGGADYIKIIVEPWKTTLDIETVKAIIDETHKNKKIAVVHVSKAQDAYNVLSNNADGLVHIWDDKVMSKEKLEELTEEKDFFVIPTVLTTLKFHKMLKEQSPDVKRISEDELKAEVKRLYDMGVPILAGTDPPNLQINYGTDLYKELKLLVEAGIPNIDVLKGATSSPIKRFNLGNKGMIKKDYVADMILIDGNPLENIDDISKIKTVWKAGKKVTLE
ncbi:amidohydrolase family protein [Aureibaculum sp. 2210JD6-5]|uniref:amidohydrolase family protein n=1 Tax=Aureibaculum sp. 2210JD6-5 TaxID=3103957 RepID=UPI002AADE3DC|nr:amidohydrolase family protein [Aureibaculum sp. 2210JD6-5]MDY7395513.1 amidohydrolase family protein [Aureibaculum sp. 2210JD6-5]